MTDAPNAAMAPARSPWRSIWLSPRGAMRYVLDTDPRYFVLSLAMIGGTWWAIDQAYIGIQWVFDQANELNSEAIMERPPWEVWASGWHLAPDVSLFPILGVMALAGPVLGVLALYVAGWLVSWVGRCLGGQARARHIRAALAWGAAPLVAAGLLRIPLILLLGPAKLADLRLALYVPPISIHAPPSTGGHNELIAVALLIATALMVVAAGWSIFTTIKCTAEAQRFSSWRAALNLVVAIMVAGLVVVVPYLGLATFAVMSEWMA